MNELKIREGIVFERGGLIPSPKDDRDYNYENVKVVASERLPKKFRLDILPVRDQGNAGACVGFAGAALQESDEMTKMNHHHLSPLYLYAQCKARDGLAIEGTNLRTCMKVLKDVGICPEKDFPYTNEKEYKKLKFPPLERRQEVLAQKTKVSGYARLYTNQAVKSAIYNENGVLLSVLITDSFEFPQKGVVGNINGFIKGYHAITLIGWDDDLALEFDYGSDVGVVKYKGGFIFKNSWGPEWGVGGLGIIPYDVFDLEKKKEPPFEIGFVDEAWTTFHTPDPDPNKNRPDYHKMRNDLPIPPPPAPRPREKETVEIVLHIGEKWIHVDGELKGGSLVAPAIMGGTTMIPLRGVFEAIGQQVGWYPTDKEVKITLRKDTLMKLFEK